MTLAIAYGVRADWLIGRRLELHVEGSYLPLDPQIRTIVAAGQAVESIARHPPAPHSRLLILTPREEVRVFGARSGKEYALDGRVSDAYDLQRAVLSGGRALRVFFPQIDSVRFAPHWSPEWAGWVIAKRGDAGTLELFDDTPSGRSDLIRSYEKEGALHFAEELRTLMDVPSRPPKPSQ